MRGKLWSGPSFQGRCWQSSTSTSICKLMVTLPTTLVSWSLGREWRYGMADKTRRDEEGLPPPVGNFEKSQGIARSAKFDIVGLRVGVSRRSADVIASAATMRRQRRCHRLSNHAASSVRDTRRRMVAMVCLSWPSNYMYISEDQALRCVSRACCLIFWRRNRRRHHPPTLSRSDISSGHPSLDDRHPFLLWYS